MTETSIAASMTTSGFFDQVSGWFKWVKITAYSVTALFLLMIFVEAARLYSAAHDVHPLVGVLTILLFVGAAILIIIPAYRYLKVPKVVQPPRIPGLADLRLHHLVAEVRYLERYLDTCARNAELVDKRNAIDDAREALVDLSKKIRAGSESQTRELSVELGQWTESAMPAILDEVDAKAEKMIYQEALNVGLGTAVSPNGTLDAFVMLWRSVGLASRLATLYYGRPGMLGTLTVCRDVSLATAAAAYLHNVTDSLGSVLAKSLGSAGSVVAGPAVEGITNALVLIRIGYLTKERCRSFRRWDTDARKSAVVRAVSATQKVAIGLSGEILRKVGIGLGAIAGVAMSGVSSVASATVEGVASAAESAKSLAKGVGDKIGGFFRGGEEEPSADGESSTG
jgi:uncharacterized membrane protein YcjF (UPF0283 family)